MRIMDAEKMAIRMMSEHGLIRDGWTFGWNKRKQALGLCQYGPKRISLSHLHIADNDEEAVRNTILHEIAHAKVGHEAGHGPVWRAVFLAIGGDGKRCGESEAKLSYAWVGRCHNGHETKQHRAPLRVRACGRCSNVFKPENIFVWHKNGRRMPIGQMPIRYVQEATRMQIKHGAKMPV